MTIVRSHTLVKGETSTHRLSILGLSMSAVTINVALCEREPSIACIKTSKRPDLLRTKPLV